MARSLAEIFHIRAGEGRLVGLCLLFSFFIGLARTFTGAVARPLFLVVFDAQTLPYLYLASAVTVALGGYLYAWLEARVALSRLVLATLALLTGSLVLFRLGLAGGAAPWLVMALSIWLELMWVLTSLAFWGPAGRLFNVRQGKRLFGLIGAGEMVAIVIAGLCTPGLVRQIGTHNLLWIAVAGLAGCWVLYALIAAVSRDQLAAQAEEAQVNRAAAPSYRELFRQRYVALMFGFSILTLLGFYVLDTIFYDLAAIRYPDEAALASFVGLFLAGSGLLSLVTRAFVSGPAINRFGLLFGLLALPVLNGLGAGAVAISGSLLGITALVFWLATLTKVFDKILSQSISQTSFLILYQPLPVEQRMRVQTAIEGIVEPIAAGLAGLVLLALNRLLDFGAIQLAYVLVVLLAGSLVVTLLLNAQYPGALMQAMAWRRLEGVNLSLADSSSVAVLQRGLRNPHAGVVLASLNMLEEIEHESLPAFLQELVTHPAPEVRQEVLRRLERLAASGSPAQALATVRERVVSETVPAVRGTALRTLAALGESDMFDEVFPFLDDPEPAVRVGAMVGLLRSGGIEGVLAAGERLLELIHAADPAERALAAQVLGDVGISSFYRPLAGLLRDEAPLVRRAALAAAARLRNPRLWPLVIECLAVPQVRTDAAAALVAAGEDGVADVRAALARPDLPPAVRLKLVRVCGRVGGPAMLALLREHLDDPSESVSAQALLGLTRCGYRAAPDEIAGLEVRVLAAAGRCAATLAALVDVGAASQAHLVQRALAYQFEQSRDRVLLLLACMYDAPSINRARENLAHRAAAQRAYALEIIDVLLEQEWKPLLLPLFDDLPAAQRLQRLHPSLPRRLLGTAPRLATLAQRAESPWVRACSLQALRYVAPAAARQALLDGLAEAEPLLRETALGALFDLDPVLYTAAIRERGVADPALGVLADRLGLEGATPMLSTIEKVLILKTVGIFASTPDEVIAEIASLLEEIDIGAEVTLFYKGDLGTSLYVIASGRVRIHDGERVLNELGEGEVFGEQGVLDTAPRLASVTAIVPTRLLRLDQEPLYQLMADRIEVVRGIISVLSGHLRSRVQDIAELHARIETLTAAREGSAA